MVDLEVLHQGRIMRERYLGKYNSELAKKKLNAIDDCIIELRMELMSTHNNTWSEDKRKENIQKILSFGFFIRKML